MTESEWLSATDPELMLAFLEDRAGGRKLRLFSCACCRRIWHLLSDARVRGAVEVAERFADGLATEQERHASWAAAHAAHLEADAAKQGIGALAVIGEATAGEMGSVRLGGV
jgi:hypothetical protein